MNEMQLTTRRMLGCISVWKLTVKTSETTTFPLTSFSCDYVGHRPGLSPCLDCQTFYTGCPSWHDPPNFSMLGSNTTITQAHVLAYGQQPQHWTNIWERRFKKEKNVSCHVLAQNHTNKCCTYWIRWTDNWRLHKTALLPLHAVKYKSVQLDKSLPPLT